jgi:hypothetical protein
MSETPSGRQTGINKHGGEQVGSVEANSRAPGSRSLQAGGEFLKALASDVAAVASRLRLLLTAKRRRTRPSRPSAPSRILQGPPIGRLLWRLSIALFGFVLICAGALSGVTLWVLFSFPPEPQKSDANTLGSHFEARKGEPLGSVGPVKIIGAAPVDPGREPGAQGWPEAEVTSSGSSSPDAAEPKKATKETRTERGVGADQPQLARTEPQDRRPAAPQREISTTLTDLRPRVQCNVDLCAATYKSFHAADCTYQPNGGGPRSLCELSTRSAEAAPQTSRAATDPRSGAKHLRVAERAEEVPKSATPARAEAQCKIDVCSATYKSFHAADCTYQPHGGGPRRICER